MIFDYDRDMTSKNWPTFLILFLIALPLAAQEDKPKDPFKEKKQQLNADDPDNVQKVLWIAVEFIRVPKSESDKWSDNSDLTHTDVHANARELVDNGDAKVVTSTIVPARSGQRAKIESVNEVVYPTTFTVLDIDPHGPTFPSAFETRNCGLTLEVDPVLGRDETIIDLNISVEWTAYLKENAREPRDRARQLQTDVIEPLFAQHSQTTSIQVAPEAYELIGEFTPFDSELAESHRDLLFLRAGVQSVAPLQVKVKPAQMVFRHEWVEVDASKWHDWFASQKLADVPIGAWEEVEPWIESEEATSMHTLVSRTKSGQRSRVQTIAEHMYPAVFKAPLVVGGQCEPKEHETRNIGYTTELDPVMGAVGVLYDLNMNPEWVKRGQDLVSYRRQLADNDGPWVPAIIMPRFLAARVTTGFTMSGGSTQLTGVFTPLRDDGSEISEKKVLLFIHDDSIPKIQ